jgi:hypothetical protein
LLQQMHKLVKTLHRQWGWRNIFRRLFAIFMAAITKS